ncbi:MAG: hypothetical protein ABIF19_16930 [Planctomycetota bacterium]
MCAGIEVLAGDDRFRGRNSKRGAELDGGAGYLHQVNGDGYINARLAVRALFMAGFKKLAIRLRSLSVNVIVTMLVEYGLEFDVAIGAKTQHGPVCDVADQKKAKKHHQTLLAFMSSR